MDHERSKKSIVKTYNKIVFKAYDSYIFSWPGRTKNKIIRRILKIFKNILKRFIKFDLLEEELEKDITEICIKIDVPIDKLRSFTKYEYRDECLDRGFAIFNKPVWETPHFELIKEYQKNPHMNVEDTHYYKMVNFILSIHRNKYGTPYVHNNKEIIGSAKRRCANIISLYEEIKLTRKINPIEVVATHDGSYIINDGLHRACIAYALGFGSVPAVIKSMDEELAELMRILKSYYPAGEKALYTPIDHPVFKDWKVIRDDTRWLLIEKGFEWERKNVLDIGSYTGYFSHKIAKLGGNVVGIELSSLRLEVAKRLNKLLNLNVKFIHADLFEYLKDKKFDCVLFFSVLHWMLKEQGMTEVKKALELISGASPVMFFDMGQDNEPKMRQEEWNHGLTINKERIPELVILNSKYRYFKHLGTGDTGRDVFKFTILNENGNF